MAGVMGGLAGCVCGVRCFGAVCALVGGWAWFLGLLLLCVPVSGFDYGYCCLVCLLCLLVIVSGCMYACAYSSQNSAAADVWGMRVVKRRCAEERGREGEGEG